MGIYKYVCWLSIEAKTWGHYVPCGMWKRLFVLANGSVGPLAWKYRLVSLTTILAYTNQKCNVAPYSDGYEPVMDVTIVHAKTRYTISNGRNFILVLNEALYMPNLPHSLVNQNQIQNFRIVIQDNPYLRDPMNLRSPENDFIACLESTGTIIHSNAWSPTSDELNKSPRLHLALQQPWDPYNVRFLGISLLE